jgi:hypothetical protein
MSQSLPSRGQMALRKCLPRLELWIHYLNHCPSVGTFHGTSLQKELHPIKSAFLNRLPSCDRRKTSTNVKKRYVL